ncbi:zinc-binding dehydrogenase [Streptomyces decoyicus]|uniref:zinc-binding dehydrogenase n=1 Tax=Streptomyces decoyicus TaxID=249567 RepID=UPI003640C19F
MLQTAAGSTVGRLVIQLARHLGIRTINVVRRRDAVEEIKALGGDEVICTEDEDLLQRVAEIAGSAGVHKAIDCVAGPVGAQVSQALAPGGEVVVYGALSTHRQTDPAALTIPLPARSVIYETKAVRGFWLNRWFGTSSPADALRALSEVRATRHATGSAPAGPLTSPCLVVAYSVPRGSFRRSHDPVPVHRTARTSREWRTTTHPIRPRTCGFPDSGRGKSAPASTKIRHADYQSSKTWNDCGTARPSGTGTGTGTHR